MVLLVEDDHVDAVMVKRALEDAGATSSIIHVTSGESALAYLRSDVNQRPHLILLDLNTPKMNGLDFLREVKANPALAGIPVVVLTGSVSRDDVSDSFRASVAGYVTKPADYVQLAAKVRALEEYWQINRLPGDPWEVHDAGRPHLVG